MKWHKLCGTTILCAVAVVQAAAALDPAELWQSWPEERFVETAAPCLRPADLGDEIRRLAERHPEGLRVEEAGRSFLGRPIHLLTLGQGERKVLLWSQMHGDEPSATPALLDLADHLLSNPDDADARAVLDGLTLLLVPMLNPDGSEVYERRNAQGIDVNRDALNLTTPEGRTLKRVRDERRPILGFNLHDQNRRTAVTGQGVLATIALLAVAGDPEGTITPGRLRAKRACSAVTSTLTPFNPGGTARYDEDWSPRAFGDNITAWGTPVVLIESGGLPPGHDFTTLTRLNFVALATVLRELVRDDLGGFDPAVYDALPRNESNAWVDVAVRGGAVLQPGAAEPYRADLVFNVEEDDREVAGCASFEPAGSRVFEIGDARFLAAGHEVEAGGHVVMPAFVAGVRGLKARRWLDADALAELAGRGVGEVRWAVPPRRRAAAEAVAERLAVHGLPRITVTGRGSSLPRLVLDRSLAFSWADADDPRRPGLRPGRPASFLVVAPGEDGTLGEEGLAGVWIDGVEIRQCEIEISLTSPGL